MDNLKKCTKCLEWKELSEFNKDKYTKDDLSYKCKKCYKEYNKKRYKDNSEKLKYQKKDWYKKNTEKIKKYNKGYREENIEKIKDLFKKYNKKYCLWESVQTNKIKSYEEIRQGDKFLEIKCTYCGKWYKPTNREINSRLNTINGTKPGENRLYCSTNCKKECPIYRQVKYPKDYKKATSREVQPELRQLVLERDNYTCQKCNLTQNELKVGLHCHHKEGILWNPIESADMDMCITLCKNCHKEVHKIDGCKTSDMKCEKE